METARIHEATKYLFHVSRNVSCGSRILFSETLRSSGKTARETLSPSERPMDLRLSDPFFIPFLKDFEGEGGG